MPAESRTYIETSVGQSVGQVIMVIDGVHLDVVPVSVAAARLGYTRRRVHQLLDSGQLIGAKVDGRWWVLSLSIKTFRVNERQTFSVVPC